VGLKVEGLVNTKTGPQVFIAVLFIIAPNWKQPKAPSTDEWINKVWNSRRVEYLAIERNKASIDTCYDITSLQNIMLNQRHQSQKAICCMDIYVK